MKKLVMIGCAHYDPKHDQRLARALERYKPKAMTLELSQDRLVCPEGSAMYTVASGYARAQGNVPIHLVDNGDWQNRIPAWMRGDMQAMMFYMENKNNSTFELIAKYAKIYENAERIPPCIQTKIAMCAFLDLEQYGLEPNGELPYYIYTKFLQGEIPPIIFRRYIEGNVTQISDPSEAYMAGEIKRRFGEMPDGTLVHVGGIFHMIEFENEPTLYKLLMDLNPERASLLDF